MRAHTHVFVIDFVVCTKRAYVLNKLVCFVDWILVLIGITDGEVRWHYLRTFLCIYRTYYSSTRIFKVSDELLWCPMNYYRDDELNFILFYFIFFLFNFTFTLFFLISPILCITNNISVFSFLFCEVPNYSFGSSVRPSVRKKLFFFIFMFFT